MRSASLFSVAFVACGSAWLLFACSGGSGPVIVGGPGPSPTEPGIASPAPSSIQPEENQSAAQASAANAAAQSAAAQSSAGAGGAGGAGGAMANCVSCADKVACDPSTNYCTGSANLYTAFANCVASGCLTECGTTCTTMPPMPCSTCVTMKCMMQLSDCAADN